MFKDMYPILTITDVYLYLIVFLNCMIMLLYFCMNYLITSDIPFGYQKAHSITMCTLIYNAIINQYIHKGNDVYSCLLDASKAFDRVHYGKL